MESSEDGPVDYGQSGAAALAAASPWVIENVGVEIRAGVHGFGVFATRQFDFTETVVEELALASLPSEPPEQLPAKFSALDLGASVKPTSLAAALHLMFPSSSSRPRNESTQSERAAPPEATIDFMLQRLALYAPIASDAASRYTLLIQGQGLEPVEEALLSRALLLIHFCSIQDGITGKHLLLAVICHANHSCFPNCHLREGRLEHAKKLVAQTSIKAGQELTFCYPGPHFGHQVGLQKRQAGLLSHFEFECSCPLCSGGLDAPSVQQVLRRALITAKPPGPPPPRGSYARFLAKKAAEEAK